MLAREAVLRDQYARLALAKQTMEELHDNGDLCYARYYAGTTQLSKCMAAVDDLISALQLEAELQWPKPCSEEPEFNYGEYLKGIFEDEPPVAAADDEKSLFESAELKQTLPNVDTSKLFIPTKDSVFEITRLRITP